MRMRLTVLLPLALLLLLLLFVVVLGTLSFTSATKLKHNEKHHNDGDDDDDDHNHNHHQHDNKHDHPHDGDDHNHNHDKKKISHAKINKNNNKKIVPATTKEDHTGQRMMPTADKKGVSPNLPPDSEEQIAMWKARLGNQLTARNHKSSRVIAIGDLHGDIDAAKEIFRISQVTNDAGHWNSGTDTVVQMGDVLDRGPHGFLIMDFLQRLKEEARHAGGELIQLLGNHELMNYFGDFRFVHPKIVDSVGGIQKYAELVQKGGKYGSIIERLPVGVIRNGTVFVHAGMTEVNVRQFGNIDDMNAIMRRALNDLDRGHPIVGEHGPVWTRQNVYGALAQHSCTTTELALRSLSALESHLGKPRAHRLVVGHTIMTEGEPRTFCNGALFAIDVEMSAYMPGGGYLAYYEQMMQGVEGVQPITLFTLPRGTWAGHPALWYPGTNGSLPEGYREHADGKIKHDDLGNGPGHVLGGVDHSENFAPDDEDHHLKDPKMVAVKPRPNNKPGLFRGTFLVPVVGVVIVIAAALVFAMWRKNRGKKIPIGSSA